MKDEHGERRARKRFGLTEAEYTDVLRKGERVEISVKDISEAGLRFWALKEIPKDTVVLLNVNFFPVYFPIRSAIVWTRPSDEGYEHGAEFINIPPEEHALLCAYIRGLGRGAK
jgi:hypothetical protein